MNKIEKIVGRLLLTDQINSEEAVLLLEGLRGIDDNSEENSREECGCHAKKYAIENDYDLNEMTMDECIEKLGFIPDEVLKRHGLEQLVDEGNSTECNMPNCSCKDEKYFLHSVGSFSVTNITDNPYLGGGSTGVRVSMMQHQPYCKSKGALASEDCICCHYTYNSGVRSEKKNLFD